MTDVTSHDLHQRLVGTVVAAIRTIKDPGELPAEITGTTRLYPRTEHETGTLELDSLDALDLITELEHVFDTEVYEDIDVSSIHTVDDVAHFIADVMRGRDAAPQRPTSSRGGRTQ